MGVSRYCERKKLYMRAYRARPEWRLMKWRKRIARFAHLALLLRQTA